MPVKLLLKKAFFIVSSPALLFFGADHLIRRSAAHRRLIVMYHGVVKRDQSEINGRNLSVEQFERQLQYFKKNFNVIPLSQLFAMKLSAIIPKQPTLALTFDDGLENNFTNVLPLLQKYEVPAAFFISTVSIENENYVLPAEMIEIIRAKTKDETLQLGNYRFIKKGKYGIFREDDQLHAYAYIMRLHPDERKEILNEFAERYSLKEILQATDKECWKLMNADQVRQLSLSSFAEVGSHAHEHFSLANLNDSEAELELKYSKQLLESCTGKPVDTIAYPNGSYDERVKRISRECGYNNLLAAGFLKNGEQDILPRVGILEGTSLSYNLVWINRSFGAFGF